jgi:hypothetical protein
MDKKQSEFSKLYKDGIIKSEDDNFRIKMTDDVVKVNGKKLPADLQPKYRELLDGYFEYLDDIHF